MIWLLKMIIFGHVHKWTTFRQEKLFESSDMSHHVGYSHYYRCEGCGAERREDLT